MAAPAARPISISACSGTQRLPDSGPLQQSVSVAMEKVQQRRQNDWFAVIAARSLTACSLHHRLSRQNTHLSMLSIHEQTWQQNCILSRPSEAAEKEKGHEKKKFDSVRGSRRAARCQWSVSFRPVAESDVPFAFATPGGGQMPAGKIEVTNTNSSSAVSAYSLKHVPTGKRVIAAAPLRSVAPSQ